MKGNLRQFLIKLHKKLFKQHYRRVLSLLQPNVVGLAKEGFGKEGDGTYILPVTLIQNSKEFVLLSFGVSNDISFEKDFNSRFPLIDIYAFDPTIPALPEEHKNINFFKIGLAGKNNVEKNLMTLTDIFNKLNLSNSKKYILKIDIEGWEWDFLAKLDFKKVEIPIIAIELHFLPLNSKRETLFIPYMFHKKYKILKNLLTNFYVHHVHANNYHYLTFNDFRFPSYIEVTLVNKNNFTENIISEIRLLNKPTLPEKEDFQFPFHIN